MNNKSCFFIGHREVSTEILPARRLRWYCCSHIIRLNDQLKNRKVLTVPIILRTWKRCPVALQLSEQTDMWWIMLII